MRTTATVRGQVLAVLFCLLAASAASVAGQANTGTLEGVVRDESGGVLPGATVTATHAESGFAVERVTGSDGRFYMASLPIGEWTITTELPGFRRVVRTGIFLDLGRTIDLAFQLDLGQLTEEVTVSAAAPLLQSTTAEISDVIDTREVEQIPLNGRQFLQLAQLSDAVVIPPGGTRGAALQQAGPLPNVGGQRAGHNIYLLDGREGDRRAVQQPGDQPVGRLHPGVQDPEVDVPAGVRRQGVGSDQRRHQVGRQPVAWQRLRVRPRRAVRRPQLLRPARRAGAAAGSAPVRRQPRRPARRRPDLRLRQLRRAADEAVSHQDLLGAVGAGPRR